ncbi:hypothetical protein BV898_12845 [Hypsibius exemplaris]|uniref:SnoaL-like domain-containing protein n=1 Tax=Hypsibius exemplaris TaxID=2072580 RepID=A0A1W0WCI7_HYPEX|nr:hypothetical protein BV898_12845 [Hypsibius exemplaris]
MLVPLSLLTFFTLAQCRTTVPPMHRPTFSTTSPTHNHNHTTRHERESIAVLRALQTNESHPFHVINPHHYTQHDLVVADGLAGLLAFQKFAVGANATVQKHRVFQDGNHVFLHMQYDLLGPLVSFDVFRFEHDRIVEHWDNLQTPSNGINGTNKNGHTMLDGPVGPSHHHETARNKEIVRNYIRDFRNQTLAPTYFNGLIQHNPTLADTYQAWEWYVLAPNVTYFETIHKVLGEGDFVLVMSEGDYYGTATGFYDLFRLENGLIVEHWDTMQAIPPKADWKNPNGKW